MNIDIPDVYKLPMVRMIISDEFANVRFFSCLLQKCGLFVEDK